MKKLLFGLLIALVLSSVSYAQQGIALNPNFAAPMQYVQTAGNNYQLLPTAGLELSLGYVNAVGGTVLSSLGLFFEGNIGNTSTVNSPAIFNTIVGLEGGLGVINLTAGLQTSGTPLGGPGSSGVILGASFDVTQALFGTSAWIFKF